MAEPHGKDKSPAFPVVRQDSKAGLDSYSAVILHGFTASRQGGILSRRLPFAG
ncbi:hypothetical protein GCWU000341_01862 [Oribacterium sp. oral taxon 078 str. F0262]|nr:hypothetical protein GCWU000341_01862 [Oribacterium sp. oral taxon 078 str. F0262]